MKIQMLRAYTLECSKCSHAPQEGVFFGCTTKEKRFASATCEKAVEAGRRLPYLFCVTVEFNLL